MTPERAENVVELGVPVEQVWEAITTPEGLTGFMADQVEVEPGVGGHIQLGWGGEMNGSRDGDFACTATESARNGSSKGGAAGPWCGSSSAGTATPTGTTPTMRSTPRVR